MLIVIRSSIYSLSLKIFIFSIYLIVQQEDSFFFRDNLFLLLADPWENSTLGSLSESFSFLFITTLCDLQMRICLKTDLCFFLLQLCFFTSSPFFTVQFLLQFHLGMSMSSSWLTYLGEEKQMSTCLILVHLCLRGQSPNILSYCEEGPLLVFLSWESSRFEFLLYDIVRSGV